MIGDLVYIYLGSDDVGRDLAFYEVGLLRPDRPGALEHAYADPANANAVRTDRDR